MNIQTPPLDTAHRIVIHYGNWLFRYREMVFPIVVVLLFAGFPQVVPRGDYYLDLWMDLLGLLVAGLGEVVRVAVVGLTSIKRAGMNKQIYADRLVIDGIFAHVRNPLYLGNLLILVGLFIIHNNPFVYVLGSLFFLSVYCSLVAAEEAFLLQKFGADYAGYCQRVNRWLPNFTGLWRTVRGMRFNGRRALITEYASTYTWILVVIALEANETLLSLGIARARSMLEVLGITLALMTAALVTIRYLKKQRILTDQSCQ